MSDEEDENANGDVEHMGRIAGEVAEALAAPIVVIKLQNGREIVGTIEGFSLRSRTRKDEVTWSGYIKIRTEPGVLQIDILTVDAVAPK